LRSRVGKTLRSIVERGSETRAEHDDARALRHRTRLNDAEVQPAFEVGHRQVGRTGDLTEVVDRAKIRVR